MHKKKRFQDDKGFKGNRNTQLCCTKIRSFIALDSRFIRPKPYSDITWKFLTKRDLSGTLSLFLCAHFWQMYSEKISIQTIDHFTLAHTALILQMNVKRKKQVLLYFIYFFKNKLRINRKSLKKKKKKSYFLEEYHGQSAKHPCRWTAERYLCTMRHSWRCLDSKHAVVWRMRKFPVRSKD